jgi:hypothetical protein
VEADERAWRAETGFRKRGIVYLCANAKEAAQCESLAGRSGPGHA